MLVDLIKHASEIVRISPSNSGERAQLVRYINRAAEEIYNSFDLPGSLWEREFSFSNSEHRLITVPWYVGLIKGARRFSYGRKIQLVDPRPRYQPRPWHQPFYQWRILGDTPLSQHMTITGFLKIRLEEVEESPLKVVIKGQTTTAEQTREEVEFPAGTTEMITTKQWRKSSPFGVISLTKPRTLGNVRVYQNTDNREVALIPNCLRFARNRVVQIHDGFRNLAFGENEHVELLFKWFYVPLEEDEDQFLGSDIWDQAIVWKMREHWHSTRPSEEDIAIACALKCKNLLQELAFTTESEVEKKLQMEEDPYAFAPLGGRGFSGGPAACTCETVEDEDTTETDMKVLAVQGRDELRRITGYVPYQLEYLDFLVVLDDGQGGEFVYRSDSLDDDDGVDILKPDDKNSANPGRWIRRINLA